MPPIEYARRLRQAITPAAIDGRLSLYISHLSHWFQIITDVTGPLLECW